MLLSRVADSLYWGSRYLERAEDTARVVRNWTEMVVDLPTSVISDWEPLLAVVGGRAAFDERYARAGEPEIIRFLVADRTNPGSIVSSVEVARENLRTTREVIPREAWQAVNDLHLYVHANAESGVDRRNRARFAGRIIAERQQLDGVMTTVMIRDAAYELWRLGESIERADMTTRVVGVRAAWLLGQEAADAADGQETIFDDVQWMGLLRSVSALQMYQRAVRGPIDGGRVVRFLLWDASFPRSVASCAQRIREALTRLPHAARTIPVVDHLDAVVAGLPLGGDGPDVADGEGLDGAALDRAMDEVQLALAAVNDAVVDSFVLHAV
jgi:uncharacterized alpha-E superfamily protein